MLERLNEEIKRRTRVVRIFPNPASCSRLVRALCAERHEGWLEDHRYLNMDYWRELSRFHSRIIEGGIRSISVPQCGHFFGSAMASCS